MQGKRYARLPAAVFSVLCTILLAGCGTTKTDTDVTSLQIDKSGRITHTIVETFDKDFYTVDGLEAMIQEEINDYNASFQNGEVLLESAALSETEAEKIVVTMQYSAGDVYSDFNGVELFFGTVAAARAAGYDMNVMLVDSTDASKTVKLTDLTGTDTNHILITNQNIQVGLPYKVLYVSEGVQLMDSKTVSIQLQNENEADSLKTDSLVYVITK
ncbi:MAG: hypothetical protein ACI4TB_06535 [Lachnospiraceae bacterium]